MVQGKTILPRREGSKPSKRNIVLDEILRNLDEKLDD